MKTRYGTNKINRFIVKNLYILWGRILKREKGLLCEKYFSVKYDFLKCCQYLIIICYMNKQNFVIYG